MRHACTVSDLDIALITGGFTIGAVIVTFGGNAVAGWLKDRRATRDARDQAIAEVLAAAMDLVLAVASLRVAYQHRTALRERMLIAAAVLPDLSAVSSWRALTDISVVRPMLRTVGMLAREQDTAKRTLALDYAATVVPRTNRFFAAVTALTLAPDKELAGAARKLADAGGALLEVAGAGKRKLDPARNRFEQELGAFRTVADRRRR